MSDASSKMVQPEDEHSITECTLAECPPGLFLHDGELGFKSEYYSKPGQCDAYCVEGGSYFWGGVKGIEARAALKVVPISIDDLRAQPEPAPRPVIDPVRLEALRIARDWRPELPVIEVIELATVIARFLDPGSADRVAAEKTAAGDDPAMPAWQAAEAGDVVEVEMAASECPVVEVDDAADTVETCRLKVRWPDGGEAWAINEWIKRIIRKANAPR